MVNGNDTLDMPLSPEGAYDDDDAVSFKFFKNKVLFHDFFFFSN